MLHTILTAHKRKMPRRIGRGGKRGTTSGRGTKGQRAHAGRRIRPAERDYIIRLPKRRGIKNPSLAIKPYAVNLGALERAFEAHDRVTPERIFEARLAPKPKSQSSRRRIKILGGGSLSKPLVFSGVLVGKAARGKIAKVGGKIE